MSTQIIANAIAALERTQDFLRREVRLVIGHPDNASTPRNKEMVAVWRDTQTVLASLRSLAPAPADRNDVGRNAVIEEKVGNLFVGGQWFIIPDGEKFESSCYGAGLFIIRTDKRTYDVVDGNLVGRALK